MSKNECHCSLVSKKSIGKEVSISALANWLFRSMSCRSKSFIVIHFFLFHLSLYVSSIRPKIFHPREILLESHLSFWSISVRTLSWLPGRLSACMLSSPPESLSVIFSHYVVWWNHHHVKSIFLLPSNSVSSV